MKKKSSVYLVFIFCLCGLTLGCNTRISCNIENIPLKVEPKIVFYTDEGFYYDEKTWPIPSLEFKYDGEEKSPKVKFMDGDAELGFYHGMIVQERVVCTIKYEKMVKNGDLIKEEFVKGKPKEVGRYRIDVSLYGWNNQGVIYESAFRGMSFEIVE